MAEKHKFRASEWTEAHEEFSLENKFTPATKLLWQWLIHEGKVGEEIEPDLKDFNRWIEKHRGKGYCRKTLKKALEQLEQCRVIQLVKKYTWRIVKLITRPLEYLFPRKKSQKRDENSTSQHSNPQSVETEVNSSSIPHNDCSQREEILKACADVGINFNPNKPAKIFQFLIEDVRSAIALFQLRGGHEKHYNPQGWLITCLEFRYWEDLGLQL